MSDSGRQIGDCKHGRTKASCRECFPETNAIMYQASHCRASLDLVAIEVRQTVAKAVAAERERCALLVESLEIQDLSRSYMQLADAIRKGAE